MSKSKSVKDCTSAFGTLIRVPEPEDESGPKCVRVRTVKKPHNKGEEDVQEENGVLFWVNKSGFPIDNKTWDRMWDHVARIHPEGYDMTYKIKNKNDLPSMPIPQPPTNFSPTIPISDRLDKIQNYMRTLQYFVVIVDDHRYNHTGTQFFEIRKNRPISGLLENAKEMMRESLPIKCLEAVILGIHLTNGFLGVERFPLSFKSVFGGNVHRHVVLGIYYAGSYGTIGMSRREDLMYKPLIFKSLADLVFDYEQSYNKFMHDVKKVKVGLPVPHDPHSHEFINWKALTLTPGKASKKEMTKELDTMAKEIRSKAKLTMLSCDKSYHAPLAKAKSWITPQLQSPRKGLSMVEVSKDSIAQNSLKQATKIYRAYTSIQPDGTVAKRKVGQASTDSTDYQIRI